MKLNGVQVDLATPEKPDAYDPILSVEYRSALLLLECLGTTLAGPTAGV